VTAGQPARWSSPALVASLLVIAVATLSPGHWTATDVPASGHDRWLTDVLLNIVLFTPLGAALGGRNRTATGAILIGTLLSSVVEVIQLALPGRVAGVSDILSNALGTLVGWGLYRTAPLWISPRPAVARWLALGGMSVVVLSIVGTGLLLDPWLPIAPYVGHWTPEFRQHAIYRGQVFRAAVGSTGIPLGPVPNHLELRERLLAGQSLRILAVAGPPVERLASILSIHDRDQEVLLLGVEGNDLIYRIRTRAAALGLDSPQLRVAGVMRAVRAQELLTVSVWRKRRGYCVEVNDRVECDLGFSAGSGWAFLLHGQGLPAAAQRPLNVIWMAGLVLPVGYWTRPRWEALVALAALGAMVVMLPESVGLIATTPVEMGGLLAGFFAGRGLRRKVLTVGVLSPLGRPQASQLLAHAPPATTHRRTVSPQSGGEH
jgi:VanZ family protein